MEIDESNLNNLMEFDHVIEVLPNGDVIDRNDIYAPELLEGNLDSDKWVLLDDYSSQDQYSGPVMHDSEYIGGRMARDILAIPGVYVAIESAYLNDEEDLDPDGEHPYVEGWAVARLRELVVVE